MTLARIVHQGPNGPLYGGLTWLPCPQGRPTRRALRAAREPLQASHSVLVRHADTAFYGLTTEDDEGIARRARSAAAQFVHRLGDSMHDAALVLQVHQEGQGSNRPPNGGPQYFAALIERGVPLAEVFGSEDRVRSLLAGFQGRVFTDTAAFAEPSASWKWLDDTPASAARLRRIPGNPWFVAATALSLSTAAGGWLLWHSHQAQIERETVLAAAREADPLPRYLAALQQQRQRAGVSPAQWRGVVRDLLALPWQTAGWQLQSIDCAPADNHCQATWLRRGGTYRDLRSAMPRHEWVRLSDQPLQLDQAVTTWRIQLDAVPLPAEAPPYEQFARDAGSLFQVWRTASLSVEARAPGLWPTVPGLPQTIAHPHAIRRGEIAVSQIPVPYLYEVIATTPPTVAWTRLRLDVVDPSPTTPSATRRALMASLAGSFYVR